MKYMADFEACGGDFTTCGGKCDSCSSKCSEGQADQKTPKKAGRIVAVFSGKGGTGKSVVTCLLADKLQKMGKKVAVLDADLAGPSIHYLYGKLEPCDADGQHLLPMTADSGVQFISMGNVEKDPTQPLLSYGKDMAEGALLLLPQRKMAGRSGFYAGGHALRNRRRAAANRHHHSL